MPNRIRRAHTKSRFGCQQCKKRRIKVAIPSRHTLGLVRCPRAYTRFWSRHAYQVAPSAFSDVACRTGLLHFTHTNATDTEHSATTSILLAEYVWRKGRRVVSSRLRLLNISQLHSQAHLPAHQIRNLHHRLRTVVRPRVNIAPLQYLGHMTPVLQMS